MGGVRRRAGNRSRRRAPAGLAAAAAAALSACAEAPAPVCADERVLNYGFFAYFEPVSFSADGAPGSAGSREHRG